MLAKYAVTLLDSRNNQCWPAGPFPSARTARDAALGQGNEDEVPVSPVGNGLVLRAQAYRTSLGWSAAACSGWWARSAP
jgi:hypothetical protein